MIGINSISLRQILVSCCAFWAPWGPAITLPFVHARASRAFASFAVLLIVYWCFLLPGKLRSFPKSYNLLVLLIVVHTCVTYGLVYPEEFRSTVDTIGVTDGTLLVVGQEGRTLIARYFLNLLFAYALASAIRTRRDLMLIALAFGFGFCAMMVSVSSQVIFYGEKFFRYTGGFLNPNELGQSAMVAMFLSMLVLLTKEAVPMAKVLGTVSLLAGFYGLVSSGSRSAMIGMCIGFTVILWNSSFKKRLRLIVLGGLLGACVLLFISDETWNSLSARLSVQGVAETRVSYRPDIFNDYLTQFPKYAIAGVGLHRATKVTMDTYTTPINFEPHNAYLGSLVEFGCLGLVLLILSLRQFWRGLAIQLRHGLPVMADTLMLGFLLGWAVLLFAGSSESRSFCFSLGIIAACRRMNMQDEHGLAHKTQHSN